MTQATDLVAQPRSLKVLLVEDERATAQALATLLSRRGHVVTVVGDVHEALEARGHDVVVADVSLPSGSGLDVLAQKRAQGELAHAIVTTGDAGVDTCRAAFKLGVAEYLAKPFRPDDLVRAVEGAPAASTNRANPTPSSRMPCQRASSTRSWSGRDHADSRRVKGWRTIANERYPRRSRSGTTRRSSSHVRCCRNRERHRMARRSLDVMRPNIRSRSSWRQSPSTPRAASMLVPPHFGTWMKMQRWACEIGMRGQRLRGVGRTR